jgi:hypothetical protein
MLGTHMSTCLPSFVLFRSAVWEQFTDCWRGQKLCYLCFVVSYLLWLLLLLPVGNEEKCVVIFRCFRETLYQGCSYWSLRGPVGPHTWFFPPYLEEVFHVNPCVTCVTCALCLCLYFRCIYWLKLSSSYSQKQVVVCPGCVSCPACHNTKFHEFSCIL